MALAQSNVIDGRCPLHGCVVLIDSACEMCLADSRGGKYGAVTLDRHLELQRQGLYLHVFYQGQDVTNRCTFADDTDDGVAVLFLLNVDGKKYLDRESGEIAWVRVHGIELRAGEPFNEAPRRP